MGKLFGTDGVRGIANEKLTPELAYRLGRAGAYVLCGNKKGGKIVVGKDTRVSGDMLEAALAAGICSVGVDVLRVGIIPTAGVAYLTRYLDADAGVMISASHNPVEDNGIKFFDKWGYKLDDSGEAAVEEAVLDENAELPRPTGLDVGRVYQEEVLKHYIEHILGTVSGDFKGLKVVVDGAYGAAWEAAPAVLRELGAEVIPINCCPDGSRINVGCGATDVEQLKQAVLEHGADVGIAHDGDADRIIAVDEKGNTVDGDAIMVICGLDMADKGILKNNAVVVTVMSNLGLELAFKDAGVSVYRTPVGDKYVLHKMLELGASLGGEQSGHIIFTDHCTTGDGIVTACRLLSVVAEKGAPLSELAGRMKRLPQKLVNVRVKNKEEALASEELKEAVASVERELGDSGRVLVRPSGTEPVIRIMVECPDKELCGKMADHIAEAVKIL
ncbi:MAG: phosphoglucosamine mutase [Clostridia bacterium]|nr:phosphoglucosamine mutase [Clostridia bacterium]